MTALASDVVRARAVQRVLWVTLLANWAVAAAKVVLGVAASSAAVTADGLHSFIDGSSNIIGLVAMRAASRPADAGHPYGHQKFEALASLAIGAMLGVAVVELGQRAVRAIVDDVRPDVQWATVGLMVVTVAMNASVSWYEGRAGRRWSSPLLLADAKHTLSDVAVSLSVLASLGLSSAGVPRADGFAALAVLGFVAFTGWGIVKQAAGILADAAQLDVAEVRAVAMVEGVTRVASVRSRGMAGSVFLDLVVEVDGAQSLEAAHRVSDAVEAAVKARFASVRDVVVHVEPARGG